MKTTESLRDEVVVTYSTGSRKKVNGTSLYTNLNDAKAYLASQRDSELDDLNIQLGMIHNEIQKVMKKYEEVPIENIWTEMIEN